MMFCQRKNGSVRKIWAVLILLMGCAVLLAGCGKGNIAQEKAERRAKFDAKMEEFGTNFSYKDYKEIIGIDRTQLMAVPQEATQIDPKAERYYDRQKAFAYRNDEVGAFILLEISASDNKSNEWSHSMIFLPGIFNAEGATYGEGKCDKIPDVIFATESFVYDGYSYTMTCLTGTDGAHAGDICVDFCRALVKYVTGGKL